LYYKLFTTPDQLKPPVLSEEARNVSFTSARQYNGTVTAQLLQQNQLGTEPPKFGFKAEMKATLQQILADSLAIISPDSSRAATNTEQRLQPLRTSIDRMYATIAAYQTHEARELLCQDMAKQLVRLSDIKNELTRCVRACVCVCVRDWRTVLLDCGTVALWHWLLACPLLSNDPVLLSLLACHPFPFSLWTL
jgi:hypothetical protein